jgi:hypothetical protein
MGVDANSTKRKVARVATSILQKIGNGRLYLR